MSDPTPTIGVTLKLYASLGIHLPDGAARNEAGVTVLCAGVAVDDDGRLVTAGGRVLNVIGQGPDIATARTRAYTALSRITWPGLHHRTDIAGEITS